MAMHCLFQSTKRETKEKNEKQSEKCLRDEKFTCYEREASWRDELEGELKIEFIAQDNPKMMPWETRAFAA